MIKIYLTKKIDGQELPVSDFKIGLNLGQRGRDGEVPEGVVIDPDYVHTDNNYDDAAVAEVAKIAGKANSADVYTKSETYTKTEINNKLSAVYKFKGSVLTYDLLPTDAENADVWNVVNGITPELNGMNYAWNSTLSAWDAIGGIVGLATLTENGLMSKDDFKKLSDLYTKEDFDLILANKSDVGHNHSGETINPEAIDFDLTPTTDPNIQGRMQYSPTERTIEFGVEGGTIDVNKELFDYYVDTNNDLVEGNVVSVTGISGNRQAVTKTNHTSRASATACVGMVTHKNADNTVRVTKSGRVRKLNTGGMTEGLPVYANATGGFTQTEPNAGDYFIHVGIVEVSHAVNGIIDVDIRIVYDVEDLSNVDGAATTVGSGDSFFIKAGNLWKTITESNFLSWFRGLSHTWSLIQDFAAGLKTDSITKRNGSGLYTLQDGGTIWHTTKWFTPTGTFSSVGTAVTTTGGQLTSGMVGAKIGVGEDKRVITAFLNSNQCTVDSAFSQDYSGVVSGSWGVYSIAIGNNGTYIIERSSNGTNIRYTNRIQDISNTFDLMSDLLSIGSNFSLRFSGTSSWFGAKDTGIRRVSDGLLEIFNGITNGTLRDLKLRSLYGDKIIPNSDTTGFVIRNAADSADVVKYNGLTGEISFFNGLAEIRFNGREIKAYQNGILNNFDLTANSIYFGGDILIATGKVIRTANGSTSNLSLTTFDATKCISIDRKLGLKTTTPETDVDINGTTTHRDYTYFNNGTHTGDAVGDIRMKNISGVLTFYRCTVGNTTKGSGTWEQIHTIG